MKNTITKVVDCDSSRNYEDQRINVVTNSSTHEIQIQIEQDGESAYVDLTKYQALKFAKAITRHCDELPI